MENKALSVREIYDTLVFGEYGILRTVTDDILARISIEEVDRLVEIHVVPKAPVERRTFCGIVQQDQNTDQYAVAIYRFKSGGYLRVNIFSLMKDNFFKEFVFQFMQCDSEQDIPPQMR